MKHITVRDPATGELRQLAVPDHLYDQLEALSKADLGICEVNLEKTPDGKYRVTTVTGEVIECDTTQPEGEGLRFPKFSIF